MAEQASSRNTYGNIFKALALFGGVKIVQILISVLRSKLIAVLLGPAGMGINNLLASTTNTINGITGFGLQTSAVRDVAKTYDSNDLRRIDVIITTLRILVWLTGFLGTIIVFAFARPLSFFIFDNADYTSAFRILSIMMLFMQINIGQITLLQGTFHYKDIARATIWGQILSLVCTIPLYYIWGNEGIVPALLISSLITLIISSIYSHRVKFNRVKLGLNEFWNNSKRMLSLGLVIALGGVISNASSYLLNIFIARLGSVEAVGLYSAAMTIANSYVFLVLSAMTTDYVPRLSALADKPEEQIEAINKQITLVTIILTPLLVAFTIFAKETLQILYSPEFLATVHMLEFLMLGMFFRAISWCLSYAFISRGDSKVFLINETIMFVVSLSLNVAGFMWKQYTGIGISLVLIYIIYTVLMYLIAKRKFRYSVSVELLKMATLSLLFCSLAVAISVVLGSSWLKYAIGIWVLLASISYSIFELNKRVQILKAVKQRFFKK
jgi:O-antigen/teichoic acid export membrane protein